jgi:hypothetical protein
VFAVDVERSEKARKEKEFKNEGNAEKEGIFTVLIHTANENFFPLRKKLFST